jgi:uncharacterized protein
MPWDFWVIFAVLGVLIPWRGRARLKKLFAISLVTSAERISLYLTTIAFQWTIAAVIAWRGKARGLTPDELGLVVHGPGRVLLVAIVGAATLGGFQWLNLRRMGRSSGTVRQFMQKLAERILPQSGRELVPYLALAVTAGICEEFIFRGFAMAALRRAGLPVWAVVLLSSALFGLAHLYQGRGGLLGTLVIGTVFGIARIAYDGLVPVAVWHMAFDAVAGLVGPTYLLRGGPPTADIEVHKAITK